MDHRHRGRDDNYDRYRGGNRDRDRRPRGGGGGDRHGGGASHLARIHGTEEDRVNCPFYFKMGACRHGDRCSRAHNRPLFSQTLLFPHMYANPNATEFLTGVKTDPAEARVSFEDFFIEVFEELSKSGEVEEIVVCDNLGDHMVGNVYAKFYDEEDAAAAMTALNGRYFAKRPITVEVSPVTDFGEARCRKYDDHRCERGPFCNFMHVIPFPNAVLNALKKLQPHHGVRSKPSRRRSSRSPSRRRRGRSGSRRRSSRSRRDHSSSRRRDRDRHDEDKRGGAHFVVPTDAPRYGDLAPSDGQSANTNGAPVDIGIASGPPPVSRPLDPRLR